MNPSQHIVHIAPATTRQFAAHSPGPCAGLGPSPKVVELAYAEPVSCPNRRPGSHAVLCLLWALVGCRSQPPAEPAQQRDMAELRLPSMPLGLDLSFDQLPRPPDPARARLGRSLFFDPRLSADNSIACASCHQPELAFAQNIRFPTGHGQTLGRRRSMPLINLAFSPSPLFFWDGRAHHLENQVLGPLYDPKEMAADPTQLAGELEAAGYAQQFDEVFGSPGIDDRRLAQALADYVRTRLSGDAPWDRWKAGDDDAVSPAVKRGDALFFGKAECFKCHFGPTFSDGRFHNLGIGWNEQTEAFADQGRGGVTGRPQELGAFKTPTLRDVARRPPYMHDGSLPDLRAVVEHYVVGGIENPRLSSLMEPLDLDEGEVNDLVAMLKALDGRGFSDQAPERP